MPPLRAQGRVIAGRYNLVETIGRGAMGVVWRARDSLLDRDVAIKEVVLKGTIGDEERENAYKRTMREARTAARLSHRGVVTIYDVAEEDGRPWIIMELVPSLSLDQRLSSDGPLPPRSACRIGQQLLAALAAAHAAGVLHRDVKPSNVLIADDPDGERAVLTDFGIAQFAGDPRLTQTGMVMGSPGFTAPERIRGGTATPASDLWSLGATLYAAVEGRGPYEKRGGAITTMSAIINEDAPPAPSAGPLGPLIAALLRRNPMARPPAATAAHMFASVLPLLPEPTQPVRRAPTLASAIVPAPALADATSRDAMPVPGKTPGDPAPDGLAPGNPALGNPALGNPALDSPAPADMALGGPLPADTAPDASPPGGPPPEDTTPGDASPADAKPADTSPTDPAAARTAEGTPADARPGGDQPAAGHTATGDQATRDGDGDQSDSGDTADGGHGETDGHGATSGNLADALAAESTASTSDDGTADEQQPRTSTPADTPSTPADTGIPPDTGTPADAADTKTPISRTTATIALTTVAAEPRPGTRTSADAGTPADTGTPADAGTWTTAGTPADAGTPASTRAPAATGTPADAEPPAGGAETTAPQPPPAQPLPVPRQRPRRRRRAMIAAVAVVLAAAIGVTAELLTRHEPVSAGTTGTTGTADGTTGGGTAVSVPPDPVRALNDPAAFPPGWTTETVQPTAIGTASGFSIGIPPGWTERRSRLSTYLYAPDGVSHMEIDLTRHDRDNILAEAEYVERHAIREGHLPGYHRVSLRRVSIRGSSAAFWAFTWVTSDKVRMRVDDLLFDLNTRSGPQSYAVYLTTPATSLAGDGDLSLFNRILRTFQPVES